MTIHAIGFLLITPDQSKLEELGNLVIPYFGYSSSYSSSKTSVLTGPEYFIFRDEILANRGRYEIKKEVSNILISMGGANPNRAIEYVLEVLCQVNYSNQITLLKGPAATIASNTFEEMKDILGEGLLVKDNSDEFVNEVLLSDLVITGGGLTKYETICLGVPTASIQFMEENVTPTRFFAEESKSILNLGLFAENKISSIVDELEKFIYSFELRKNFIQNGSSLSKVDGADKLIKDIIQRCNHG